jgi:hypothetical protein
MECMLMTMALEESTFGQNFKSTLKLMGALDQPKLMSSMWQSGREYYCTYLMQSRAQRFPTWRKLCHFSKIIDISYTDATKLRDIVKASTYYYSDTLVKDFIYSSI